MGKDKHHDKKHHGKDHEKHAKDKSEGREIPKAEDNPYVGLLRGQGGSDSEECMYIFTCMDCGAEQDFTGVIFEEDPLCPECARPMQAKSGEKEGAQKVSKQVSAGEWGGKGGFSGESGANIFTCPECTADKAFPGMQPGEQPQCPICAIPMKAKYVEGE